MPNLKDWRDLGPEELEAYLDWLSAQVKARWSLGQQNYGPSSQGDPLIRTHRFQGNPIAHAQEETFDNMLYLWQASRQRKEAGDCFERIMRSKSKDQEWFNSIAFLRDYFSEQTT